MRQAFHVVAGASAAPPGYHRPQGPLTAGVLAPCKADRKLDKPRRTQLDRLYQQVLDDLDNLLRAVGLKTDSTARPKAGPKRQQNPR